MTPALALASVIAGQRLRVVRFVLHRHSKWVDMLPAQSSATTRCSNSRRKRASPSRCATPKGLPIHEPIIYPLGHLAAGLHEILSVMLYWI